MMESEPPKLQSKCTRRENDCVASYCKALKMAKSKPAFQTRLIPFKQNFRKYGLIHNRLAR